MKIKQEKKFDKIWIITIEGNIQSGSEFDLENSLTFCLLDEKSINSGIPPYIIIDLSRVNYMNSAALGVLIQAYREVDKRKGYIGLYGLNAELSKLLSIAKLDNIFEIFKNEEEALDYFLN